MLLIWNSLIRQKLCSHLGNLITLNDCCSVYACVWERERERCVQHTLFSSLFRIQQHLKGGPWKSTSPLSLPRPRVFGLRRWRKVNERLGGATQHHFTYPCPLSGREWTRPTLKKISTSCLILTNVCFFQSNLCFFMILATHKTHIKTLRPRCLRVRIRISKNEFINLFYFSDLTIHD